MRYFDGSQTRVLVVDDDTVFCELMREILRGQGYQVRIAYDAQEAMQVIDHIPIDLVLTDVMMPEIDGLTLIRSIRAHWWSESIPTIVVSARVMPEEVEAARCAGADAFVPKPFSIRQLLGTINATLAPGRSLAFDPA